MGGAGEGILVDIIHDSKAELDLDAIGQYIGEPGRQRWADLNAHIEGAYRARPQIAYSVCAGKPGWNVKYKKGGRALCTLYPEPDGLTALVVLSAQDIARFEAARASYTDTLNRLFDETTLFNGTRWLMIRVEDDAVLEDVKRLFTLKLQP